MQDDKALINRVIAETKKMSLLAGKETLYQAYDMTFGIHDYVQQAMRENESTDPASKRPLSSVAMHSAEDFPGHSTRIGHLMKAFAEYKIATHFGISFPDFLKLPVEYVGTMLTVARENSEREAKAQSNAIATLNQSGDLSKK